MRKTCRRCWRGGLLCVVMTFMLCMAWNLPGHAAGPPELRNAAWPGGVPGPERSLAGNVADACEGVAKTPLLENTAGRTWVIDGAGLLNEEEVARLNEKCRQIYDTYGVLVAVVTVDDFGGGDILEWQKRVFSENPFDVRAQDGVMLAVSMAGRDWGIQTFGDAQRVFNTYGRERIGGIVVESLSDGDYYDAFADFAELGERFLKEAEEKEPYSSEHPYRKSVPIWVIVSISFVLSLTVSLVIVSSWKKGMNTQVPRNEAGEYLKPGSFRLTRSSDVFLYHTVSRSPKPKQDSGGGSGMHSTSSGTSGKF